MKFIQHPQHSTHMGAPTDWNEQRDGPCGALSIHDMREQVTPKMESCWEPTELEGLSLALGLADIRLGVIGRVHPPVYMAVYPKMGRTRGDVLQSLGKVLKDLHAYAEANELTFELPEVKPL